MKKYLPVVSLVLVGIGASAAYADSDEILATISATKGDQPCQLELLNEETFHSDLRLGERYALEHGDYLAAVKQRLFHHDYRDAVRLVRRKGTLIWQNLSCK